MTQNIYSLELIQRAKSRIDKLVSTNISHNFKGKKCDISD